VRRGDLGSGIHVPMVVLHIRNKRVISYTCFLGEGAILGPIFVYR